MRQRSPALTFKSHHYRSSTPGKARGILRTPKNSHGPPLISFVEHHYDLLPSVTYRKGLTAHTAPSKQHKAQDQPLDKKYRKNTHKQAENLSPSSPNSIRYLSTSFRPLQTAWLRLFFLALCRCFSDYRSLHHLQTKASQKLLPD